MSLALRNGYAPQTTRPCQATTSAGGAFAETPLRSVFSGQSGWIGEASDRLLHLARLPKGWDGHAGRPADLGILAYSMDMLAYLDSLRVPMPSIVPMSNGSIQIEWHRKGWDLEIEIPRPGRAEIWTHELGTGDEHEAEITADFRPLRQFVDLISD